MKLFFVVFLLFISLPSFSVDFDSSDELMNSDDLMAEDDLVFSNNTEHVESASSWINDLRVSLQSDFKQRLKDGGQVELDRVSLRLQYETSPWKSSYFKLDGKYSYFGQLDTLARTANQSYGVEKLNDAWFQYSHQDCAVKLGVQGLFWGAVEGAFAVDVITPFDTTEPLLTDYSSIRSTQNMVSLNCFQKATELELFYIPKASLDLNSHKNRFLFDQLEDDINDEWGIRISKHWEGVDVAFMYARLYGNSPNIELAVPTTIPATLLVTGLVVPRYNMFGMSAVWAIDRLLVQLDVAYKTDQISTFTVFQGQNKTLKDKFDIALGFDYTNAQNHQFHLGFWQTEALKLLAGDKTESQQAWNVSWRKQYINDTLTTSLLGFWVDKPERYAVTVLAEYQWDDYWTFSSALQYTDSKHLNTGSVARVDLSALFPSSTLTPSNTSIQFSAKYQF